MPDRRLPYAGAGGGEDARLDALLARMTLAEKIAAAARRTRDRSRATRARQVICPASPAWGSRPMRFADGPPGVLTRYPATALTASHGPGGNLQPRGCARQWQRDRARCAGSRHRRGARAVHQYPARSRIFSRLQHFRRGSAAERRDRRRADRRHPAGRRHGAGQALHRLRRAADVSVDRRRCTRSTWPPFAAAVDASVASIMCAYNVVNGSYACGNHDTLTYDPARRAASSRVS